MKQVRLPKHAGGTCGPLESSKFTSFRSFIVTITRRCLDSMLRRRFIIAAFVGLLIGLAAGCGDRPGAQSRDEIIGTWRVLSVNDKDLATLGVKVFWHIDEDEIVIAEDTGAEISRSRYRTDPTQQPKHLDMEIQDIEEEQRSGIYELEASHLRILQAVGGGARPANFDEGTVMRFERVTNEAAR